METTYLKEFIDYSKKGIAYLPIGTIEWHGNHLPIETDFMVAQKICEIVGKEIPGYILPPFYLGTDRGREVNGKTLNGMDGWLGKKLPGNLYYLNPDTLYEVISEVVGSLSSQGFKKVFIITGHGGSKHIEILEKVEKDNSIAHLISPYKLLQGFEVHHADEGETSVFWAFYPEEEEKGRKIEVTKDDDFYKFKGYDVREKASFQVGQKMKKQMIDGSLEEIRKNI